MPTMTLPTVKLELPTGFQNDDTMDGWELVEDAPFAGDEVLEFVNILREREEQFAGFFKHSMEHWVSGEVMFNRALELGENAGRRHAECLFGQRESIPKELRPFFLVFPGTKLRNSRGNLAIPCLSCEKKKWKKDWAWVGPYWRDDVRIVRYK